MKVYIGTAGSSKINPYITLDDPKYLPRPGDLINMLHDPRYHTVKSVCFNYGEVDSITIQLEDQPPL